MAGSAVLRSVRAWEWVDGALPMLPRTLRMGFCNAVPWQVCVAWRLRKAPAAWVGGRSLKFKVWPYRPYGRCGGLLGLDGRTNER